MLQAKQAWGFKYTNILFKCKMAYMILFYFLTDKQMVISEKETNFLNMSKVVKLFDGLKKQWRIFVEISDLGRKCFFLSPRKRFWKQFKPVIDLPSAQCFIT